MILAAGSAVVCVAIWAYGMIVLSTEQRLEIESKTRATESLREALEITDEINALDNNAADRALCLRLAARTEDC